MVNTNNYYKAVDKRSNCDDDNFIIWFVFRNSWQYSITKSDSTQRYSVVVHLVSCCLLWMYWYDPSVQMDLERVVILPQGAKVIRLSSIANTMDIDDLETQWAMVSPTWLLKCKDIEANWSAYKAKYYESIECFPSQNGQGWTEAYKYHGPDASRCWRKYPNIDTKKSGQGRADILMMTSLNGNFSLWLHSLLSYRHSKAFMVWNDYTDQLGDIYMRSK